jgi:drug/metabolite transporter (DMT)-like permease
MILGMFFFGITNAVAKATANDLPSSELIFFRGLVSSFLMLLYAKFRKSKNLLKVHNPKQQIWRGTLGFFQLIFLYWSFAILPMADATAISFATTLFVTALAFPMLKERVGIYRWTATLIGFSGVLFIAHPTGSLNISGALYAILAAFLEAVVMIYARQFGKTTKAFTTVFYYTITTCIIGGILSPFFWITPTFEQVLLMSLLGFAGTMGHIFIAMSYRFAEAAVVAPMFYTLMIWGIGFGYFIWDEIPTSTVLIGAALIIACGLYIVHRERKINKDPIPKQL